jgi:glycosyltransferase involved in cell wall biosynthesis
MSFGIKWKGPTLDPSGYGSANRAYVTALNRIGADLTIDPWDFDAKPPEFYGDEGKLVQKLRNRNIEYDCVVHHYVPNRVEGNIEKNKMNVAYNTWETTQIPRHWVEAMNKFFDLVLVPSEFNAVIYESCGVVTPIEVVPHCLEPDPYVRAEPLDLKKFNDKFKFLSVFQWTERKNPYGLLKSYFAEFHGYKDVVLVLKAYGSNTTISEQTRIRKLIENLKTEMRLDNTPPVYLLGDMLTTNQMYSLYKACDCFVLPSRGEGFGIPYAEACLGENTVIAPKFGGQYDFLSPIDGRGARLIDYFPTPVSNMPWIPHYNGLMDWAEPDLFQLRYYMREFYTMDQESLQDEKSNAQDHLGENYNYEIVGMQFYNTLERYLGSSHLFNNI